MYIKLICLSKEFFYFLFFSAFQKDKSKNKTKQKVTTIAVTTKEPHTAVVEECVRMDARAIVRPGPGFSLTFLKNCSKLEPAYQ